MCTADHNCFAYPGYLIDVPCASMAAKGALFTRMLAHHAEVGLAGNQIAALLDLSREYHDQQVDIRLTFARLTEGLELKRGRFDAAALTAHKAMLDDHASLFRADEELFFTYAMRGHDLLTDEQIERADKIYHAEKDQGLAELTAALNSAVGPSYIFQPAATTPRS